jgi:predicted nucleic acid-binding protein
MRATDRSNHASLLLYAYHTKTPQDAASRAWLEDALSGHELVGFAWLTVWAFLRIGTNPRVFGGASRHSGTRPAPIRRGSEDTRHWERPSSTSRMQTDWPSAASPSTRRPSS